MSGIVDAWTRSLADEAGRPDEFEAKRLLAAAGVAVPDGVRLAPGDAPDGVSFAGPYVIKVCGPEIRHKTDLGGVQLDVTAGELARTVGRMRERFPGLALLIERQLRREGPEMIVGGLIDPTFGPAVMAGSGGVLTELREDVAFRLAPCPEDEARRMLAELVVAPLFDGFRGLRLDGGGLARLIARVSALIVELGERFDQLDINPVVLCSGAWVALDAQLTLRGAREPAEGVT
jgi:hypothetical protein